MRKKQLLNLALRLSLGWLFFYAGITKVLNPEWTAAGFLKGAKTFPGLYAWFASPGMIPLVDFLNEWGLTLLGASLMLGLFVRWAALGGALLMVLYYFPGLEFPYVNHGFLVDEHVIYLLVLLLLVQARTGHYLGLDGVLARMRKKAA